MRVEIHVDDDRARDLFDWLRREDELRGHAWFGVGEIAPGEMGGVADVIAVALGAGGAGTVLASALVAWINSRKADVKLTLRRPDGTEFTIDAHRVDDAQALIESVRKFLDESA